MGVQALLCSNESWDITDKQEVTHRQPKLNSWTELTHVDHVRNDDIKHELNVSKIFGALTLTEHISQMEENWYCQFG